MIGIYFLAALTCGIGLIAVLLPRGLVDLEYKSSSEWSSEIAQKMKDIRPETPQSSFEEARGYNFGRYRKPIANMNLHKLTASQKFAQKKEFVWTSISDGKVLIGCALLQFGYTTGAIVYLYDSETNTSTRTHLELPLLSAFGASFGSGPERASSAVSDCGRWNALGLAAASCYDAVTNRFVVSLQGTFKNGSRYEISYNWPVTDDTMSMVFPIGPNRASVVTKMGGTAGYAAVSVDGKRFEMSHAVGMMDYTRGLLKRLTRWYWSAVAWSSDDGQHRYALQISEGVYDNEAGVSFESTYWEDGKASHVNSKVVVKKMDETQANNIKTQWSVRTADNRIDLVFTPSDVIVGDFHYVVLDGDLFHMWGTYDGTVTTETDVVKISRKPGVLEDHYALW